MIHSGVYPNFSFLLDEISNINDNAAKTGQSRCKKKLLPEYIPPYPIVGPRNRITVRKVTVVDTTPINENSIHPYGRGFPFAMRLYLNGKVNASERAAMRFESTV